MCVLVCVGTSTNGWLPSGKRRGTSGIVTSHGHTYTASGCMSLKFGVRVRVCGGLSVQGNRQNERQNVWERYGEK